MRIGVIGCGTVAQIMHIPYLAELPDAELHALVDPSDRRVETLGERYNVENRYAETGEMLDDLDDLDGVVVCTPSHAHADAVVQTLDAGIHTLVEKPLAASVADANRMVEAAADSDATAMVAYMKRYDPAYEKTLDTLDELDGTDLITAFDTDPDHERIIDEVYDLIEADLPDELIEESAANRRADIQQVIGSEDDDLVDAYSFQLEHVCHDVNALRGLFGAVENIDHVDLFADGRYATANLRYEGDTRCVLETGVADRKWFEEFIRVDAPDGRLTLEFSNPFIQNTPSELTLKQGLDELEDTTYTPSYDEPFKRELAYFLRCAEGSETVRTPFAEARDDVALIANLFREYQGIEHVSITE